MLLPRGGCVISYGFCAWINSYAVKAKRDSSKFIVCKFDGDSGMSVASSNIKADSGG
jgi:hypothetical protein